MSEDFRSKASEFAKRFKLEVTEEELDNLVTIMISIEKEPKEDYKWLLDKETNELVLYHKESGSTLYVKINKKMNYFEEYKRFLAELRANKRKNDRVDKLRILKM